MSNNVKTEAMNIVLSKMSEVLNQEQMAKLRDVMVITFRDMSFTKESTDVAIYDGADINEVLLEKFAVEKKVENLSSSTIKQYINEVRKFFDWCNKPYINVTKDDALIYLAMQTQSGKSSNTVDNSRKYLKAYFSWLVWNDYITKSPFERIKCTRREEVRKVVLTEHEVEAMRDACTNIRDLAILDLLLSTGIRVSELINLKLDDVDFTSGKVHIYSIKTKTHRIGFLDAKALKHVKDYRNNLAKRGIFSNYLFINNKKSTDGTYHKLNNNGAEKLLHKMQEKAHISKNVTVHVIRKTFASRLYKHGVPPMTIQCLLGHSDFATTSKYYINIDDNDIMYQFEKAVA